MNCRPEHFEAYIVAKMEQWWHIATWGINEYDRARARKNFLRLISAYPDIAAYHGFSQESVSTLDP